MKEIQRIICGWLVMCMLVTMLPVQVFAQEDTTGELQDTPVAVAAEESQVSDVNTNVLSSGSCGSMLTWNFDSNLGKLTIMGEGPMDPYFHSADDGNNAPWATFADEITDVVIVDGVASIEHYAFYACKNLKSVEIPESVTYIGNSAFEGCKALTSIALPGELRTIGNHAFAYTGLKSITIPKRLNFLEANAFSCSALESAVICGNIYSIDVGVFMWCFNLKEVTLPDGFSCIENSMFSGCSSLTNINIPETVTTIESSAFGDCSSLTSINFLQSNFHNRTKRFCWLREFKGCLLLWNSRSVECYQHWCTE